MNKEGRNISTMIQTKEMKSTHRPLPALGTIDSNHHDVVSTVEGDSASLVTESSSEAVVSLFNCWSSVEEASPFHGVTTLAGLTVTASDPAEVLRQLKKRLRPEDMPSPPKRRKRPTCSFINYMGQHRLRDHHSKCGVTSTELVQKAKYLTIPELASEEGPFSKAPDLSASLSPTDVELEELDLLEPLFEDEVLFPTIMMSKAKFPVDLDDDNTIMVS